MHRILTAYFSILLALMITACGQDHKGNAQDTVEETDGNWSGEVENRAVETSQPPKGQRLSEELMTTYLPVRLGGLAASGTPRFTAKERFATLEQAYSGNAGNIFIAITDFHDDQGWINNQLKGNAGETSEAPGFSSKTFTDANGWQVTESLQYRAAPGEDTLFTHRTIIVSNPRFSAELRAVASSHNQAPKTDYLLTLFKKTRLPSLFQLDIPQGELQNDPAPRHAQVTLDCDKLLPLTTVATTCNTAGITVRPTAFEKEANCNRKYGYPDAWGDLVFIVTPYGDPALATKAVKAKIEDPDLERKPLSGLGDAAVLVTVDDDLYLSVAHRTYLIELRSFKNELDKPSVCCICHSEEKLKELARKVIAQLSM